MGRKGYRLYRPQTQKALPATKIRTETLVERKRKKSPFSAGLSPWRMFMMHYHPAACYKQAWTEDDVINEISNESGKQFDPELVEVFMDCIDTFRQIEKQYPDHE
jgi:hypothetical protein